MNPFMDFPMELPKRDFFINRIISGVLLFEYKGLLLEIRSPDKVTKYRSSQIYSDYFESCSEESLYNEKECVDTLIKLGLWDEEREKAYSVELPDNLEKLKVAAYQNEVRPEVLNIVRDSLEVTRTEMKRLQATRSLLNGFCIENSASFIKKEYEIKHSTYLDGQKYDWSIGNPKDAVAYYYNSFITDTQMRELARTTPWTSFLSANKYVKDIFGRPATEMTDEQLMLLAWSSFYESVYNSQDRPSEIVINDDDMLDGWKVLKDREYKEAEKKERGNQMITNEKIANSDELFIVAKNRRDREAINALNSDRASKIKRDRIKTVLNSNGAAVNHRDLPDVKQDIEMKNTQALSQKMRARK